MRIFKGILFVIHFLLAPCIAFNQTNYAALVNPFTGTGGHGHTYPGATVPHGMVQLSPDTRLTGWDGCSGYHYSDSFIYGFSHTHLSGTGVSDYGDILLMPMRGNPSPDQTVYGSSFTHSEETASPGYYSVMLKDDNIFTELTSTARTGMHHYVFPTTSGNHVILDLKHRDEVMESSLNIVDSVTITGLRRSKAWATNQYVYFVIKFSTPFTNVGIWENDVLSDVKTQISGKNLKAYFQFENEKDLLVKTGISSVSIEGAIKNLNAESPNWDFEQMRVNATNQWNGELSKIVVDGDEEKKKIFYTALYHTAIVPNINMDVDGNYRGMDNAIHKAEGFTYYSVFSLWDTYRAAHPLYTIIDKTRTLDYIKTFLTQYQQGGRLPVWELASNETDCMIGYHSVAVIADAYANGIKDFDTKLALEAMEHSASLQHFGLGAYQKNGMISSEDEQESVSRTLEYAYDDWCIASFANAIGNKEKYSKYFDRSQYYKNVFDATKGFMRPRKNGGFLSPFDPREVNNNYTEANAWQYSFSVPQDVAGFTHMIGGAAKLEVSLDGLFSANSETTGREQSDITGLIGQYAHGNEPSHHIAYLYNAAGKPYKTQQLVHKIMGDFYSTKPDGLIGNEDCGQMSAWYVMSAMGFYPVTPGSGQFSVGTPAFTKAVINTDNGKYFTVNANDVSNTKFYVQKVTATNKALPVNLTEIMTLPAAMVNNGGSLDFTLGESPLRGRQPVKNYVSANTGFVKNPIINGGAIAFKDAQLVTITADSADRIHYTMDGSTPSANSLVYRVPIKIKANAQISAVAINKSGEKSFVTKAIYKKVPHNWRIKLGSPFEPMYSAGGADGLIDGIRGDVNWRKGNWQGYQNEHVNLVIDLKKLQPITQVTAGFLQDAGAWIVMPKSVSIQTSVDGIHFTNAGLVEQILPITDKQAQIKQVTILTNAMKVRYVKLIAMQYGTMPAWHEGAGGATHIFIDEIEIK